MYRQQLTVLTGNTARDVGRVFSLLGEAGIDVRAHCLVDNGEIHAKLRLIVAEPERAAAALAAGKLTAVLNEVVVIEVEDRPGALGRILDALAAVPVAVSYTYTAVSPRPGTAVMVFRFSDNALAEEALRQQGIRTLSAA